MIHTCSNTSPNLGVKCDETYIPKVKQLTLTGNQAKRLKAKGFITIKKNGQKIKAVLSTENIV